MVISFKKSHINFLKKQMPSNKINSVNLSKKSSKVLSEYISNTEFYHDSWPYSEAELDYLEKNGLIYYKNKDLKYQLTYKGLIVTEYGIYSLKPDINKFLDDLNEMYFEKNLKTQNKPFNPRERIILFTILGLKAFSMNHSIEFNDKNRIDFKEASNYSVKFLTNLFPEEEDEYNNTWNLNSKGLDPIVATLTKRLDELPLKTEGIFIRHSHFNIYLNLLDPNGNISASSCLYLLKKLLDEKYLSENGKEELIQAFNKIENKSILLIKSNDENMDKLKINNQLKDIIKYDY